MHVGVVLVVGAVKCRSGAELTLPPPSTRGGKDCLRLPILSSVCVADASLTTSPSVSCPSCNNIVIKILEVRFVAIHDYLAVVMVMCPTERCVVHVLMQVTTWKHFA